MKNLNEQISKMKSIMGLNEGIGSITVYHGSNTKISSFVDDFVGGRDAEDLEGPGIYFSSSRENAQHYGEHVYEAVITPRKLLTENPKGGRYNELMKLVKMAPYWEESAQNWDENPSIGANKFVNDAIKYNDNEKDRFLQVWIDFYKSVPRDYVRNCVKLGYDGIVVKKDAFTYNEPIKHYIIYNPSIIHIK